MLDDPQGSIVVGNDQLGGPTRTKIDDLERQRRAVVEDGCDRALQEVTIARNSLRQRFREESSAKEESRGAYCGWMSQVSASWTLAIEDPQEDHGGRGDEKVARVWCGVTQHQDWEATETKAGV